MIHNMAASNFPVPDKMKVRSDLKSNWNYFQSQWENYEIAKQLCDKDDGCRMVVKCKKKGMQKIYQHLDISEEDRKKKSTILAGIRKHFEPQVNVIYEKYTFDTTDQKEGESIDQYITRLRQFADSWYFGNLANGRYYQRQNSSMYTEPIFTSQIGKGVKIRY